MEFKDNIAKVSKEVETLTVKNSKGKSIVDDVNGKSKKFKEYQESFMLLDSDTQKGVLSSGLLPKKQKEILTKKQKISSRTFNLDDLKALSNDNERISNNYNDIISALNLNKKEDGVNISDIKSAVSEGKINEADYKEIRTTIEKKTDNAKEISPESERQAKKGVLKSKIGEVLDNPAAQLGIAVTATYALKEGIESLATRGGFLNDLFGIDDNFLHNLDDLNESATNTKQIADNAKADITTMENAQTSTQSRINQLMSIKDPTADQQAELKGLQGQNAELQRGIALKKQMSENLNKDATQHAMDLFQDATVTDITKKTNNPMLQGVSDKSSLTDGAQNEIKYIQDKQAALKELEEQQAKAADDPAKQKEFGEQITAVTKDIDEAYTSLNEKMESINANAPSLYNDDGSIKDGAQNIVKEVTDVQSAYDHLVLEPEDANKNDIERFFNSSGMDTIKARLMELGQEGQVGVSKLNEEFPGLIASLEESGIKTKDAIKYFNDLGRSAGEAGQQMELMKDPLEAYEEALQTENAGDDYLKIAQGLDQTKALADQGLVGTDDFKTFAKMISPDGKDDKESFYKNYEKLKSFDMESEGGRENLLKKLQEKDPGYASFDKKTGTWSVDIENTAKAADQLGIAVAPLEAMLGRLQDYGSNVNFTSMVDQFNEAQTAVGGLKELAGSMDEGAEKDALMADISNYEKQINAAKNDLSTLPPELVTELKFRYSREQMKQEIAEAQNQVNFSGNVATGQNLANHSALASKQQIYIDENKKALGMDKKGAKMPSLFEFYEKNIKSTSEELQKTKDKDKSLELLQELTKLQQDYMAAQEKYLADNKESSKDKNKTPKEEQKEPNSDKTSERDNAGTKEHPKEKSTDSTSTGTYVPGTVTESKYTEDTHSDRTGKKEYNPAPGTQLGYDDESLMEGIENANETELEDKTSTFYGNDTASVVLAIYNALGIGDKTSALNALDLASVILGSYNGKSAKNKKSVISALDQATVILAIIIGLLSLIPKTKTTTVTTKYQNTPNPYGNSGVGYGSMPKKKPGKVNGTAHARGDWSADKTEKALVGELGQETVVRDGKYFTVGDNGAELTDIRKGDIIFNHEQTKELFKKGYVTSGGGRGRSYARGTAYAGGSKKMEKALKSLDKLFDWTEIRLTRLSENTKRYTTRTEYYNSLKNKQKSYQSAISSTGKEISGQNSAYKKYMKEARYVARKTGLSSSIQKKVQNGSIKISSYDENTQKAIQQYQTWYEKAKKCKDTITELKIEQRKLAKEKLDNIAEHYDIRNSTLNATAGKQKSYRDYRDSMGYSQTSDPEYNSYVKQRSSANSERKNLETARKLYQKELNKQVRAGKIVKGGKDWYDAQKQLANFDSAIYEAKTEVNGLSAKLREINYKKFQIAIDTWARKINNLKDSISLNEKRGKPAKESDYVKAINDNAKQISLQKQLKSQYQARQKKLSVNSREYQELAEKISGCDSAIYSLLESNEDYKKSIRDLRWKPFEDGIDAMKAQNDELSDLRSFTNRDNLVDEDGKITSDGYANLALIGQQMGNYKQMIADYTEGLHKLDKELKNGNISQETYKEQMQDFLEKIRSSASSVEDLKNEILDLAKAQLEAENDALTKSIDKRSQALRKKKEYYDYDKTIRNKNKDINAIKAQIAALEGVSNKAGQAELARLKADLASKEEDLTDTKKDHEYDLRIGGYDKLSSDADEALQKTLKALETNSELQQKTVDNMLDKIKQSYKEAYDEIAKIIEKTGITLSGNTQKNVNDLKDGKGAGAQSDKAQTPAQDIAASSGASGVNTDKIDTNGVTKATKVVVKPASATLYVNASMSLSASVTPTTCTAPVKWTSSNKAVATVSSTGRVTAKKAGKATITAEAGGKKGKCSITVKTKTTKKPTSGSKKPAKKPTSGSKKPTSSQKSKSSGTKNNLKTGFLKTTIQKFKNTLNKSSPKNSIIKNLLDSILAPLNKKKTNGYKFGTLGVSEDQIARINELGKELVVRHNGNDYTYLSKGDGVIPADLTKNLMLWGRINPAEHSLPQATVNTIAPDIDLHFDKFIEVKGNLDSSTMPDLRKAQKEITQLVTAELTREFRKLGHK